MSDDDGAAMAGTRFSFDSYRQVCPLDPLERTNPRPDLALALGAKLLLFLTFHAQKSRRVCRQLKRLGMRLWQRRGRAGKRIDRQKGLVGWRQFRGRPALQQRSSIEQVQVRIRSEDPVERLPRTQEPRFHHNRPRFQDQTTLHRRWRRYDGSMFLLVVGGAHFPHAFCRRRHLRRRSHCCRRSQCCRRLPFQRAGLRGKCAAPGLSAHPIFASIAPGRLKTSSRPG